MFCGIFQQLMLFPCKSSNLSTLRLLSSFSKIFSTENNSTKSDSKPVDSSLDEDGLPVDYKELNLLLMSKRLDTFINKATGSNSASTEQTITTGGVRVNQIVMKKKSTLVEEGDDIEVWMRAYEENPMLAVTKRLKIDKLNITEKGYAFKTKYWHEYLVENWK